jgi:ABC-type spermidine/putrescine transport system permease subunit II
VRPRHWLFLALLALVFTGPLLVLAGYAVAPGWRFPHLLPRPLGDHGLEFVAGQAGNILRHLGSSVLYSLGTVLFTLALCLAPAHHFARRHFWGKTLLEGLLLAPALVPAMTFSMGVHHAFIRLGLADSMIGVVLVLATFSYPYMLRALVAGFQAYGPEYEDCARNLGASAAMRLLRVDLPLLLPAVVAGGSVVFLVAFSEYFLVFLIGGGSVPSFTGYLFPFLNSSDRAVASLLTAIFLVVPIILFVLVDWTLGAIYRKRGLY